MIKGTDHTVRKTALQTATAMAVVIIGLLGLLFLYSVRVVLLQLLVAAMVAIALSPLVDRLTRRGLGRTFACIASLLLTVVVLAGIIGAIASPLIIQGGDLVQNAPRLIDAAVESSFIKKYDAQYGLVGQVQRFIKNLPMLLIGGRSPVFGALGSIVTTMSSIAVILVLALFLLIEGDTAWSQFLALLHPEQARFADDIAKKIAVAIGGFVNGNLVISLIAGSVSLVILLVFKVPYAFALAALVAVFDLIPLVGASLAAVVITLVALVQGIGTALSVLVLMLVYQFVEGNFIQPVVYGHTVQLSRLLILVATIVGAQLGGIVGVLLAIPLAAAIQILVVETIRLSGTTLQPGVAGSVKE